MGVWSEHVSDEIFYFDIDLVAWIFDWGIYDTQLALILEGMGLVVHDEQNAAQHPDIDPLINGKPQVQIDHLWGSVHESGIFLKLFLKFVHLGLVDFAQVDLLLVTTSKIA